MKRVNTLNQAGVALLGALAAVMAGGAIGASMVAYYQAFVVQSRGAYVRSAMTNLDNKIRFMAMQPYAYKCGVENGQADIAGVGSCALNTKYFKDLDIAPTSNPPYEVRIPMPGAQCATGVTDCGFKINLDPSKNYGFKNVGGQGKFSYNLTYEGLEMQLNPGGYGDPAAADSGMLIPVEVLQSQAFDCKAANPDLPAFGGFANGKPVCTGFNTCPAGTVATSVNFPAVKINCTSLGQPDKTIDCRGAQRMIGRLSWHDGILEKDAAQACFDLPVPPLVGAPTSQVNCPNGGQAQADGSCWYSNRWCQITSADPNSATIGYTKGPGAQDRAGCGANGVRYPQGQVANVGGEYLKCMVGAYTDYPLPDSTCPTSTPTPTCPAGQTMAANGTCTTTAACTTGNSGGGRIVVTSGSTWSVPCDFNAINTVEAIGGGGGGEPYEGGAGGGGGYSKSVNVAFTPGQTVTIQVGAGGAAGVPVGNSSTDATAGGDTFIGGSSCATAMVCAKGGGAASSGEGGQASQGVGQTKFSGGNGATDGTSGMGGGGAAGPLGKGGNGGSSSGYAGGGGGGNGGGSDGARGGAQTGGRGGSTAAGGGGGSGGTVITPPTDGAGGGGGGGGGGNSAGGGGRDARRRGGQGSNGTEWDASHGSGGGGGGNGNNGGDAGNGGMYGGGGGGTEDEGSGGNGAPGVLIITFTP